MKCKSILVLAVCTALLVSMSMQVIAQSTSVKNSDDGTVEGAVPSIQKNDRTLVSQIGISGSYNITPFESVSISNSSVWQDNRHRAYYSPGGTDYVNGFLQFDVTPIPDDEKIESMTLRCYLENAFGSPYSNPVVDVYYSADDGWTRSSVTPGQLSLDVLLADNIPFTTYVPQYDFVLNVNAHDWSQDLIDNRITIGFKNDVNYYSYVYFFGAYGSPTGQPCELQIKTKPATPYTDIWFKSNTTVVQTSSTTFMNIPATAITVNLLSPSDLVIMFSSEAMTSNNATVYVRALVDGKEATPGQIQLISRQGHWQSHGFDFYKLNLPAGRHTIQMQWKVNSLKPEFGKLGKRTLIVMANSAGS